MWPICSTVWRKVRGLDGGDGKAESSLAALAGGEDDGGEEGGGGEVRVGEEKGFAEEDFAGGADEGLPGGVPVGGWGEVFGKEDFDGGGGRGGVRLRVEAGAGGEEAGGKDAGVVEDEEVAGFEEGGQGAEVVVGEVAGAKIDAEHAGAAALGWGVLGDQFRGEIEDEIGDAHEEIVGG